MNCRQTHELISAYLDQELTGREMLEIGSHLRLCPTCAHECRETAEIRRLLRALLPPSPSAQAERRLAERLTRPEASAWTWLASVLAAPSTAAVPRGRRLATALALSCVVILAVAAPFAPPAGDAAVSSGSMVTLPPLSLSPLSLPASWGTGAFPFLLHLPAPARTSSAPRPQAVALDLGTGEAEPLRDVTVTDYEQGNVALADYRASSVGAR